MRVLFVIEPKSFRHKTFNLRDNGAIRIFLNIRCWAAANSARITDVKQNRNLTSATGDAVELFITKKNSFGTRICIYFRR